MFGFLKKILKRPAEATVSEPAPDGFEPTHPAQAPVTAHSGFHLKPGPQRNGHHNGLAVEVPLQSILASLPLELQSRILQPNAGDRVLTMPLEKILAQLAHGIVRVPFGELRQTFPDIFSDEPDQDRVLVPLPLGEILSRINPALIKRRRIQKQVQVPAEIISPFDEHNRSLLVSPGLGKTEPSGSTQAHLGQLHTAKTPVPPAPPAFIRQTNVPAPKPSITGRSNLGGVSTPLPPSAIPSPLPPRVPPPRPMRDLLVPPAPAAQANVTPEKPAPLRVAPKPPPLPLQPVHKPEPPTPEPVTPVHTPPPLPVQAGPTRSAAKETGVPLMVPLVALAESWPDGVRKEIIQSGLVESQVHLPTELIERALRQGKIAFTWRLLRSWLNPATPIVASANDSVMLELPLKTVAPLFLDRQRSSTKAHGKVDIDDDIPNLFFGFPQPESANVAAAATARPSDTNYYVWDDSSDTARLSECDARRGPSAGTRFVSKYATPNEIVSRAAALDGVAGSLIALPDGLLVASQLPSDLNADTLAAFLPQIFGKVSQCTKELRMGELNNLNFTVGNVPWKIFRVNAIFFAAFGRSGEPLPTAHLASLAGELDHKPK